MIAVVIVIVAMLAIIFAGTTQLLVAANLTGDRARDRASVRSAALDRLEEPAPEAEGGSTAPAAPVEGYSDVVIVTADGRVIPVDREAPAGVLVRRTWRLATTPDGAQVFEVSAELLEADGESTVDGPGGVRETTGRTLDR